MARGKVTIPITIEARGAQQGARQVEQSFKRIEGSAQVSLGRVARTAAKLGAAYLGLSQIRGAVNATEQLGKVTLALHRNMGLSVRTASELGAQLIARGADVTRVNMAFGTLSRQMQAAQKGTKSAVETFKQLGITQEQLKRLSPDQLLARVSDGLARMKSEGARTAAAMRLFGRGWQTLRPLLAGGSSELRKQLELARKYGASFGGRTLKSIMDWLAAQRESKLATMGLQVTIGTTLIPVLTKLIGAAARATAAIRSWLQQTGLARSFAQALGASLNVAAGALNSLAGAVRSGNTAGQALLAVLGALLGRALALRAVATVSAVIAGLRGAFTGAAIGARLLNAALGASPIGRVITLVSMLAGALGLLSARFPGVRRAAETAFRAAASAAQAAGRVVGSVFAAISSAAGRVAGVLRGAFSAGWRAASAVVSAYTGMWGRLVRSYASVVRSVVGTVGGLLRGAFAGAWRAASGAASSAASAIGGAARSIGSVVSRVFNTVRSVVGRAAAGFRALASAVARVRDLIRGAAGVIGKVAGALNPFGDGPGIGARLPSLPGGRAGLFAAARLASSMGLALTSFVRPGAHTVTGALSYHALGRAMDFAGPPARMIAFARAIAQLAGPRIKELIHTPLGWGIKDGRVVPISFFGPAVMRQHYDHVHVAMREGGVVPGRGRGDRVPALLEPGEYVVPRDVVERVGVQLFEALRMRRGGRVPGRSRATRGRSGYSTDELLSILEAREARASTTPGRFDDFAVLMSRANVIRLRLLRSRNRLRQINRALRGRLRPETRRRLLDERAQLLQLIAQDEGALADIGRSVGEMVSEGAISSPVAEAYARSFGFRVQRPATDLGAGGDTGAPTTGGGATGGGATGEGSELQDVLRELADLTRQQVENQQRLIALTEREGPALVSAVAAAVSGSIGGQASLLLQGPATGRIARY